MCSSSRERNRQSGSTAQFEHQFDAIGYAYAGPEQDQNFKRHWERGKRII